MWNCFKIVFSVLRNCWEFVKSENYELPSISGRWYCRLVTSNLWSRNIFLSSRIRFWDFWRFLTIDENAKTRRIFVKTRKCYKTALDNMKEVNLDQKCFENLKISFWHRQKLIILIKNNRKYSKIGVDSLEWNFYWLIWVGVRLWFTVEVNSKY